jgi:hypothetical protein
MRHSGTIGGSASRRTRLHCKQRESACRLQNHLEIASHCQCSLAACSGALPVRSTQVTHGVQLYCNIAHLWWDFSKSSPKMPKRSRCFQQMWRLLSQHLYVYLLDQSRGMPARDCNPSRVQERATRTCHRLGAVRAGPRQRVCQVLGQAPRATKAVSGLRLLA